MQNIITKLPISKDFAYELKELKKGEKIPIISDVMFHTMLNNESRKKYVSYLISLSINKSYDEIYNSIIFVKNKLNKDNFYTTNKTVDFICKIDNDIINIEVNNNITPDIIERNFSYASRLHDDRKIGDGYKYNKVIQININNFYFKEIKQSIKSYSMKDEENESILTENLKIIHIYLPIIRKKYYNKEKLNELEKLLLVFNEDNNNSKKLSEGNEIMEEYLKESNDASQEEEVMGLYDRELHLKKIHNSELRYAKEQGIQEGIQEGIEKGVKQNKIETAKKLLENNVDIGIISSSTGLTIKEIKDLS